MRTAIVATLLLSLVGMSVRSYANPPLTLNSPVEQFRSALTEHAVVPGGWRWYVIGSNGFLVQSNNNMLIWTGSYLKTAMVSLEIDTTEIRQLALEFVTLKQMFAVRANRTSSFNQRVLALFNSTETFMRATNKGYTAQKTSLTAAIEATNAAITANQRMAQFLTSSLATGQTLSAAFQAEEETRLAEVNRTSQAAQAISAQLQMAHLEHLAGRFATQENLRAQLEASQQHYATQAEALEATRQALVRSIEQNLSPNLAPAVREALLRDLLRQTTGPVDAHIQTFNRNLADTVAALQRSNRELERLRGLENARRGVLTAQLQALDARIATGQSGIATLQAERNRVLANYTSEIQASTRQRLTNIEATIADAQTRRETLIQQRAQIHQLRAILRNAFPG